MSSRTIRFRWLVGVLGSALLMSLMSACGSSHSGSEPAGDEAATHNAASPPKESEAMPVKDSAFGGMVGTMDRARGVEKTEMEGKEAVDRAIDQNDAGSKPAE